MNGITEITKRRNTDWRARLFATGTARWPPKKDKRQKIR